MTNVQIFKEAAEQTMRDVMNALGWTEFDYAEHRYLTGRAYLHWYLAGHDREREKWERSKIYWDWFKATSTARDRVFIETIAPCTLSRARTHQLYMAFHNPRMIVMDEKPNDIVISEIKKELV